jgi:hypothetical protein
MSATKQHTHIRTQIDDYLKSARTLVDATARAGRDLTDSEATEVDGHIDARGRRR